tara:strand:- start:835 stop:2799 length:1965 start_codon:yes stop_codon:yes gene_type:complete
MSGKYTPDIYIKQIELFDFNSDKTTVQITTQMEDSGGWSSNESSAHMKILVVVSSNQGLNNSISNGSVKFDVDMLKKRSLDDDRVTIITRAIDIKRTKEGSLFERFEAIFNNNEEEVKVFCAVYFEMTEILQSVQLNTSGAYRRYGNIASDAIIQNGNVSSTTTVFLIDGETQYVGPVHFHPTKGYMAGARHTEENHPLLSTTEVINFKIKDFREKKYEFPISLGERNSPFYSNLNYSINRKGNVRGIFSIDFKNIILYNTKYGYFLRSLSAMAQNENIKNLKIKNLIIKRKRIDVDETHIVIKSFSNIQTGIMLPATTDIGSIREINDGNREMRTYTFTDNSIEKNSLGRYQYHISFSFVDPTVQYVETMLDESRRVYRNLNNYYDSFVKKKNYNYVLDKTRARFYNSQYNNVDFRSTISAAWTDANNLQTKLTSMLYNLTELEKNQLTISNSTKLDPKNATVFSLEHFKEQLNKKINDFHRLMDLDKTNSQSDAVKTFVKTANSKNVIFMNHMFKEPVILQNYSISYDYLPSNSDGVTILQNNDFKSLMKKEFDKFFTSSPTSQDIQMVPEKYHNLLNLNDSMYSYISPSSINLGQEQIKLNDISKINLNEVNKLFNPSYDKNIYKMSSKKEMLIKDVSEEMSKPNINKQEK